jgi:aspartate/methionine/tyrosine aminotransferase
MTGWRIGYIQGPQEIIDAINELQQYVVFSSSSIGQYAALAALQHHPDKQLTQKYKTKRDLAVSILQPHFPRIYGAAGAFYVFLALPHGVTDKELVNQVAHKAVVILPGSAFSQHANYVRISFAGEIADLQTGLERLTEAIENIHKKK